MCSKNIFARNACVEMKDLGKALEWTDHSSDWLPGPVCAHESPCTYPKEKERKQEESRDMAEMVIVTIIVTIVMAAALCITMGQALESLLYRHSLLECSRDITVSTLLQETEI